MRPEQPIRRPTVEDALDEALRDTFPCSDPIAVGCLMERERDTPVRQAGSAPTDRAKPAGGHRAEPYTQT